MQNIRGPGSPLIDILAYKVIVDIQAFREKKFRKVSAPLRSLDRGTSGLCRVLGKVVACWFLTPAALHSIANDNEFVATFL